MMQLSRSFSFVFIFTLQSYNPDFAETKSVWAVPISLAATKGITVLFYFPPGT